MRRIVERFERARKPEEKQQRRAAILRAARKLARREGPLAFSLNEVGRISTVSKPNIYRYFQSREHILFHVYVDELAEFIDVLDTSLPGEASIDDVARIVAAAFLERPLFCQLIGMSATILEHNVSVDAIVAMKLELMRDLPRGIAALRRALPWLSADQSRWFVMTACFYVSGMWPAAHPSPAAIKACEHPDLRAIRIDAAAALTQALSTLLAGIKAR